MAICRIKKLDNYTVVSNYFIDDSRLSLKSIGLLTKMLRLPDNWTFSLKGLSSICKDGTDGIASAIHELEKNKYIKKERARTSDGRVGQMIYTIFEIPYDVDPASITKTRIYDSKTSFAPDAEKPKQELPKQEKPVQVIPNMVNPKQEAPDEDNPYEEIPDLDVPDRVNPAQINNKLINTKNNNNELNNLSSSSPQQDDKMDVFEKYTAIIHQNVDYDIAKGGLSRYEFEIFDELVDLMIETVSVDRSKTGVKINGELYPYALVKKKFLKLGYDSLIYVIECMKNSAPAVINIRGYMLSSLYNAGTTINSYYQCEVWNDNKPIR